MIVLIQNKTIIHLKNQNQDRIIIKNHYNLLHKIKIMLNKVKKEVIVIHGENRIIMKNQHNLLNKIKIMLNKVKKKVIVIHGENRIIMKNQHNLLNKNNTRKWNKITNNIVYQKTKY